MHALHSAYAPAGLTASRTRPLPWPWPHTARSLARPCAVISWAFH